MFKKIIVWIFCLWITFSFINFCFPDSTEILGYIAISLLMFLELCGIWVIFFKARHYINRKSSLLVLLWLAYVVLAVGFTSTDLKFDLRIVLFWPTIYFLFFYCFKTDKEDVFLQYFIKHINLLFYLFALIFFSAKFFGAGNGSLQNNATNTIFFVALLSPFIFFIKSDKKKLLLFIIGFICVFISLKRSALIFYTVVFLFYLYQNYGFFKARNIPKSILIIFITVFISTFSFLIIENYSGNLISKRFSDISEDQGSGRLDIYEIVVDNFNSNKSFEQKLFGSGYDAVRKEGIVLEHGVPLSSHNDFLEILYNYGWIGLILYLSVIFRFLISTFKIKRYDPIIFRSSISALLILFIMSFVSHLVNYPSYFSLLIIVWALTTSKIR
ncbi:O-antigen ligase family protein [Sphingobacterium hotanense]|uniref:O-antigen ligase family protein n=1 Tax=Sphingobacterium hotanense TaxID=649196 RepID=UPI0021A6902C|nr:O-antigen ligase family protein [Sphingobacterium hotanense]MCT1523549.1 O-antigen ligase family protein [Sphingobacterium hotanense]